jgi:hypothetical protein
MKIKGYRFPYEVCGDCKVVCGIRVFFRKNGELSYARARHYGADKKFHYHQQSIEYINKKLSYLPLILVKTIENKSIGQTNLKSSSKSIMVAVGEEFELSAKWRNHFSFSLNFPLSRRSSRISLNSFQKSNQKKIC